MSGWNITLTPAHMRGRSLQAARAISLPVEDSKLINPVTFSPGCGKLVNEPAVERDQTLTDEYDRNSDSPLEPRLPATGCYLRRDNVGLDSNQFPCERLREESGSVIRPPIIDMEIPSLNPTQLSSPRSNTATRGLNLRISYCTRPISTPIRRIARLLRPCRSGHAPPRRRAA